MKWFAEWDARTSRTPRKNIYSHQRTSRANGEREREKDQFLGDWNLCLWICFMYLSHFFSIVAFSFHSVHHLPYTSTIATTNKNKHIKSIHKTRMRLRQLAVIHLQIHNRDYVYDKHSNTYESRVDRMEHISTPCRTGYSMNGTYNLLLSASANTCSCDVCCM